MYFKPSLTSIRVPLTLNYFAFFVQKSVQKRMIETLNLLTIDFSLNNNELEVDKFKVNLKLRELGKVTLITFNTVKDDPKT